VSHRLLLLLVLLLPASALADLEIVDAWIKNLPPSVPLRAGYMTLRNPGASAVRITSIRGEAFASIEIHRSVMQDGMMRMEPVEMLSIAAGESRKLAPGGYHLMMQPLQPTRPGQELEIVLQFDDGSEQRLTMTVIK
jgi:hypothetical protein